MNMTLVKPSSVIPAPVILTAEDLVAVRDARADAALSWPPDFRHDLAVRSDADDLGLLHQQNGLMLGVKRDDSLIACCALVGPMEMREAIALRLLSDSDLTFAHAALTDHILVIDEILVRPLPESGAVARALVGAVINLGVTQITDHIFVALDASRAPLREALLAHDFGLVAAFQSAQGRRKFVFQKPAFGFDFSPAVIVDDVDPQLDFSAIVTLTQREALVGRSEPESRDHLVFFRSRDAVNILPTVAKLRRQKS